MIGLLNCPVKKLSNNKLSNNKLSDNNLASELVEKRTFLKPITSEEIVIFTINKDKQQAPVVQRPDNAIHRINHYPADSAVCFINTYPLDSDLSGG